VISPHFIENKFIAWSIRKWCFNDTELCLLLRNMSKKLLEYSVNIKFLLRPLQNVIENLEQCAVD